MKQTYFSQFLPLILTCFTCFFLVLVLVLITSVLNILPTHSKIVPHFHFADMLVGFTIYIKTSIDFAIFIGNLMSKNPGWKNRIAIEIGTALGNGVGTFFVLILWTFFKEIQPLLALMIFLAACVLFHMAEDGVKEFISSSPSHSKSIALLEKGVSLLHALNRLSSPLLRIILPESGVQARTIPSFLSLILFSFSVPFILGLDDFAGYIPLFSLVNVVSFSTGIFLGHMLLNIALFASPRLTIQVVKFPPIMLTGSFAFLGIGVWGLIEATRIFIH